MAIRHLQNAYIAGQKPAERAVGTASILGAGSGSLVASTGQEIALEREPVLTTEDFHKVGEAVGYDISIDRDDRLAWVFHPEGTLCFRRFRYDGQNAWQWHYVGLDFQLSDARLEVVLEALDKLMLWSLQQDRITLKMVNATLRGRV